MSGRKRVAALLIAVLGAAVGLLLAAGSSAAKPRPYHHHPHLHCTPFKPVAGTTITVNGDDFLPHDHVVLTLHTTVYPLGSVNADEHGDFGKVVQLPPHVLGAHTIVATGQGSASTDVASCDIVIAGSGSAGQGSGGNHGSNGGGTSITGVEVAGIGIVGVGLLVGGGLLVLSARKRRTAETD